MTHTDMSRTNPSLLEAAVLTAFAAPSVNQRCLKGESSDHFHSDSFFVVAGCVDQQGNGEEAEEAGITNRSA